MNLEASACVPHAGLSAHEVQTVTHVVLRPPDWEESKQILSVGKWPGSSSKRKCKNDLGRGGTCSGVTVGSGPATCTSRQATRQVSCNVVESGVCPALTVCIREGGIEYNLVSFGFAHAKASRHLHCTISTVK